MVAMTITFRQIDAFHAIAETGSFAAAARRLGTTQSAISKRIAELEAVLGVAVFDRSQRSAQLTLHGHTLLPFCAEFLALRQRLHQSLGEPTDYAGRFGIGVTVLVALTFLPDLIAEVRRILPRAKLEPVVKLALDLHDDLRAGAINLAIMPILPSAGLTYRSLGQVEMAWMCNPRAVECPGTIPLARLADYPILGQTERSSLQVLTNEWLLQHRVAANLMLSSNNLSALGGLTLAGFGISMLPKDYFFHHVESGRLKIIKTIPAPPALEYYVAYRQDGLHSVAEIIADWAVRTAVFRST
jgi:DNA-binding transcriptional LysR family regulator